MPSPLEVLHLPVRTKSGQNLGVVTDVLIDPDTHTITSYAVRAHRLIPAAITKTLLIGRAQVVGFDEAGMIVDDAVVGSAAFSAPQPAASS